MVVVMIGDQAPPLITSPPTMLMVGVFLPLLHLLPLLDRMVMETTFPLRLIEIPNIDLHLGMMMKKRSIMRKMRLFHLHQRILCMELMLLGLE